MVHGLSHPNKRVTSNLIRRCFVWPFIKKDIRTKTCLQCQLNKVGGHNRTQDTHISVPDERFRHIHLDIVGPLRPSRGKSYMLTMIDRFISWPEAIPLENIAADTIAAAFINIGSADSAVRKPLPQIRVRNSKPSCSP